MSVIPAQAGKAGNSLYTSQLFDFTLPLGGSRGTSGEGFCVQTLEHSLVTLPSYPRLSNEGA
jgi:hypothetical protein